MHAIEHTYVSLLADVSRLSGFSEIRGSYGGLHWCLNEAPLLEKKILESVETGCKLDLDLFPVSLRRIALGSLSDPILMRLVRQLLLFAYKAYVPHSSAIVKSSCDAYLKTNQQVQEFGDSLAKVSPILLDEVRRQCQSVLYRFRPDKLKPCHGPGASTTPKEKWSQLYSTIEYCYPFSDWFCFRNCEDHQSDYGDLQTGNDITAKLIAVPKDTRGPRLICVHPAEAIWLQQGLRRELERCISVHRFQNGPWPRGRIHFDDQTVNGKIAHFSSASREYATLDMKEASDRISEPLVQILFGSKYKWFGCTRAQKLIISHPDYSGSTFDISCYAPMGNATCFPVQSLVFWAICVASMKRQRVCQPGAAFVFGDDIIVPSRAAQGVINDLETFGLVVNRTKSFWRGGFRESCGVDAFNGVNVTPIRWKTTVDAEQLVDWQALSDMAMRLRIAGYEETAATVYSQLRQKMKRFHLYLPYVSNILHGGIAEYSVNESYVWNDTKWYRNHQKFISPVWRLEVDRPKTILSGWNHAFESVCSLEHTGHGRVPDRRVSRRARLVRGWIDLF